MGELVLGLYTEGSTDQRFLQPIIRRTTTKVLAQHSRGDTWDEVLIMPIKPRVRQHESQEQKILAAASDACGYHLLIVHIDADCPTFAEARRYRFDPGLQLVKQTAENVCQDILPIIPVQEIEAWLLADKEILLKELNTNKSVSELGIPPTRHIESIAQPKERLEKIIRIANQSRRRPLKLEELYEPLGETVRLDRLDALVAYRQFISDLTNVLIALGIILQMP